VKLVTVDVLMYLRMGRKARVDSERDTRQIDRQGSSQGDRQGELKDCEYSKWSCYSPTRVYVYVHADDDDVVVVKKYTIQFIAGLDKSKSTLPALRTRQSDHRVNFRRRVAFEACIHSLTR
jgi:hypothetical protein